MASAARTHSHFLEELLRSQLGSLAVTDGPLAARITQIKHLGVDASAATRKGKRYVSMEVTLLACWEGFAPSKVVDRITRGSLGVNEVTQDDVAGEFAVPVTLDHIPGGATGFDAKCREIMAGAGTRAIRGMLRDAYAALQKRDEEPALLGPARAAAAEGAAVGEGAAATAPGAAAGSQWNPNAFHWEERTLTAWSKDRLAELLRGVAIAIPGGSVRIVEVELAGTASASIRRAKSYIFFEFSVSCKWEGEFVDDNGNVTGTGDGEVTIADIDQDSGSDYVAVVSAADDGGAVDKRLQALFQSHGTAVLREKISQFVGELKEKAQK